MSRPIPREPMRSLHETGRTVAQIAAELGLPYSTVHWVLRRMGLKPHAPGPQPRTEVDEEEVLLAAVETRLGGLLELGVRFREQRPDPAGPQETAATASRRLLQEWRRERMVQSLGGNR
jgi:hypothetical protein